MRKYCVISHTHWDREWYIPLENFKMRLVDMIDNLLEILNDDPEYRFHLDAQTIVLEDYLSIHPHRRDELVKYVTNGQLLVGPWYVQNDFYLTDGEATVRNLIIGMSIAESFGGCMQVGYAADQFGIIAQLPQIYRRFGIDNCVFGRGYIGNKSEFFWKSEDGSRVFCEHMTFWYNNAQRFSPDPNGALNLARGCAGGIAPRVYTGNYLLMNGVDHLEAQEDLLPVLRSVRPLLEPDEEIFQDTLPEFIRRVTDEIAEKNIEIGEYTGELRHGGAGYVLTGTLSSRIDLKRMNAAAQTLLDSRLEPLYSIMHSEKISGYPYDWLRYLWKLLIENHPHDSICASSTDAVHAHMIDRFIRVKEAGEDLLSRGLNSLAAHIDRGDLKDNEMLIVTVNTLGSAASAPVNVTVNIPAEEDTGAFVITDTNGNQLPFSVERLRAGKSMRILSPINLPGERIVNEYTVKLAAGTLAPLSVNTFRLTPTAGTVEPQIKPSVEPSHMENEYLAVTLNGNGTVDIFCKENGETYRGLMLLEDTADRGTSYNYVPVGGDTACFSDGVTADIEVVAENAVTSSRRVSYKMPVSHPTTEGVIGVSLKLTLDSGCRWLRVDGEIDNSVDYHRLRMLFPTGIRNDSNYSGAPFDCFIRNKNSIYNDDATHPNTDYVGIEGENRGFAVLNIGLYEYEQPDRETADIALTVLRSTGRITGDENAEKSFSDWLAPGDQCHGLNGFNLAIYPYTGNRVSADVAGASREFASPVLSVAQYKDYNKFIGGRPFVQGPGMTGIFQRPLPDGDVVLPACFGTVKINESAPGAMRLSAFKRCEHSDSLIVRWYNCTSESVTFTLPLPDGCTAAYSATLGEKRISLLGNAGDAPSITAAPKEIVTVELVY